MEVIFVRYLPLILIGLGFVALVVTARPFLIGERVAQRHANFKSLRRSSPMLNGLIAASVVGKPVLEFFQKNNWNFDVLPGGFAVPVTLIAIASVFALIIGIVYFFFRAIRNINFFSDAKIRSPYAAFFILVPITNIVVLPYLEYFTLYRSKLVAVPEKASKWRSMALAFSSYMLFLIGLAYGRLSDDPSQSMGYNPLALLIISLSAGGAGGILTSWVISGVADAQDFSATQRGLLPPHELDTGAELSARRRRLLQSSSVVALLIIAAVAAIFPQGPAKFVGALTGN